MIKSVIERAEGLKAGINEAYNGEARDRVSSTSRTPPTPTRASTLAETALTANPEIFRVHLHQRLRRAGRV